MEKYLDTIKPTENNTENIEKVNKRLDKTKYEVISIKKQVLKTDSNYKKLFNQLQENKIEIMSLKEKVNIIECQLR